MPKVKPNTWKVICVVIRQTLGWVDYDSPTGRKQDDRISWTQFMEKAGISSKETLNNALQEALDLGIIKRFKHAYREYHYTLNWDFMIEVPDELAHRYENRTDIGTDSVLKSVRKSNTQKKRERKPKGTDGENLFGAGKKWLDD
jgi:hypothetical protein